MHRSRSLPGRRNHDRCRAVSSEHAENSATRSAVLRCRRCAGPGRKTPWSALVSGPTTIEHAPGRTVHRYHDPTTGQFLTVDPLVAQTGQPYYYANDDPVNNVDPTGDSFWGSVLNGAECAGSDGDDVAACAAVAPDVAPIVLGPVIAPILEPSQPSGLPTGTRVPNNSWVVRGGENTVQGWTKPGEINAEGLIDGGSVNSFPDLGVPELSVGIKNKQIGVSTVAQVEYLGGVVIAAPTARNPYHALLSGISPEEAHLLFTPTIQNPPYGLTSYTLPTQCPQPAETYA